MESSGAYVSSGGLSFARICGTGTFDVGDFAGGIDLVVSVEGSGEVLAAAAAEEASRIRRCEGCACLVWNASRYGEDATTRGLWNVRRHCGDSRSRSDRVAERRLRVDRSFIVFALRELNKCRNDRSVLRPNKSRHVTTNETRPCADDQTRCHRTTRGTLYCI